MRASGIEGDRVFQLQGGIHRYMEEFKDGGLFMGKVSVGWSLLMGKVGVQWQGTLHQGHAGHKGHFPPLLKCCLACPMTTAGGSALPCAERCVRRSMLNGT